MDLCNCWQQTIHGLGIPWILNSRHKSTHYLSFHNSSLWQCAFSHVFSIIFSFRFAGAFLIPFFVMLILEGIPLFLIELGIGQRMRLGSLGVWNTIHPWLGGIGISSCIVTLFVTLYYNVVITWCFFYLLNSFRVTYFIVCLLFQLFFMWIKHNYRLLPITRLQKDQSKFSFSVFV